MLTGQDHSPSLISSRSAEALTNNKLKTTMQRKLLTLAAAVPSRSAALPSATQIRTMAAVGRLMGGGFALNDDQGAEPDCRSHQVSDSLISHRKSPPIIRGDAENKSDQDSTSSPIRPLLTIRSAEEADDIKKLVRKDGTRTMMLERALPSSALASEFRHFVGISSAPLNSGAQALPIAREKTRVTSGRFASSSPADAETPVSFLTRAYAREPEGMMINPKPSVRHTNTIDSLIHTTVSTPRGSSKGGRRLQ